VGYCEVQVEGEDLRSKVVVRDDGKVLSSESEGESDARSKDL